MATPIQYLGARGQAIKSPRGTGSGALSFEVSDADIRRIRKKLESVKDKPMRQRVEKALWAEADTLASKIRSAAPKGPTGNLKRSVSARRRRRGSVERAFFGGAMFNATLGDILVGPEAFIAPHRHFVIRGTGLRPSTSKRGYPSSMWRKFGGKAYRRASVPYTGRMTANPFVDRATGRAQAGVVRAVEREWFSTL